MDSSDNISGPGDEAHTLLTNLESQAAALMLRVQRLQGRQCQRHLQRQMQSFVRREQTTSGLGCQLRKNRDNSAATAHSNSNGRIQHKNISTADPIRLLDKSGVKSMPTSALADIVRSWECQSLNSDSLRLHSAASVLTSNRTVNSSSNNNYITENSEPLTSNDQNNTALVKMLRTPSEPVVKHPVDQAGAEQIEQAAGQMRANLEHLEEDYDSDATESSSGGESCDDSYGASCSSNYYTSSPSFSSKKQSVANLQDSMTWTWAVQRGAIASRWMWLIAQVADLEFKIRQQNEMYRSLRLSKGPITLENVTSDSGTSGDNRPSEHSQCVRTMPLRNLKKRKLVRSNAALSGAVRKTARYSTVQCSCSSMPSFVSPCVLCNGRYGYVQVIDTDCMPQCERIAILDPASHPVLSLPTQVPLGLHFSKFLKKETVQKAIIRKVNKSSSSCSRKKSGNTSSPESSNKFLKDERRSNHKKPQALVASNKLKKKYDSKRKYSHNDYDFTGSGKKSKSGRERHESSSNGSNDSSRQDSPIQSPIPTENSAPRRRRSEYAYDINNIVIPYSIASTTRVEKLQYKEILTPKWRVTDFVGEKQQILHTEEDGVEDLSDSAFSERHLRCEMEEKKRFLTFLTPNATQTGPGPKRSRGPRVRCDSRGDALTPSGNNGYGNHAEDCNSQDSEISNHHNHNPNPHPKDTGPAKEQDSLVHGTPARAFERRRTTSSSRTRDDSVDDEHLPDVQPFEKRMFPLEPADIDELVSDSEEPIVEMNGKYEEESTTIDPSTSQKTIGSANHVDLVTEERPTCKSTAPLYVSSSGETDQDDEDPEWEPKEHQ